MEAEVFVLATLVGLLITVLKYFLDKRKTTVDVSASITHAAAELVDDMRQEIERRKIQVTELREREKKHREEIGRLRLEQSQSRERITALETESEMLREEMND